MFAEMASPTAPQPIGPSSQRFNPQPATHEPNIEYCSNAFYAPSAVMQSRPPQWVRGCFRQLRPRHLPVLRIRYASSAAPSGSSPEVYDVVCVGGGPAGLSLLTGLRASRATAGLKMALIEGQDLERHKLDDASPTRFSNRCSSLTPASAQYLKEIGAWSHIDASRVQPYQEMQVWDGVTGSRISFDWDSASSLFGGPQSSKPQTVAYMIENLNITTGLMARLAELGKPDIFSPTRVEKIQLGDETPDLDLRTWPILTLSDGKQLAARLLVGADGANSPVRAFAGIASRGWDYGRHGVVATLQLAGPGWGGESHKIAYQRFLPTGPVAMLPMPGSMASLVWSTEPAKAAKLKSLSHEDFVAMVNAAFRLSAVDLDYLHSMGKGQREEVEWREKHTPVDEKGIPMRVVGVQEGSVAPFPLKLRHADTYIGERVALVGDAAHTVHPLAGQGLNQGQGDAASLVETIKNAVLHGQDIGSQLSLEPYVSERWAINNAMLGVVDKLHKLYSVGSGPIVPLRSLGLAAVDKMGPLKGFFMRQAAGTS